MGSRGAYSKGRIISDEEIEAMREAIREAAQWESDKRMDREEARKTVKDRILGKILETEIFDEHCTGIIKFNSKGLKDVLSNYHTSTSEKKWALERLKNKGLKISYGGFEEVNPLSHNYLKKIKKGFTGFNKYDFSYMGNNYTLKTAIIKDRYEQPYYVYKK